MNSTTPRQDCCAGFPAGVTFSAAVFAVFALLTYGSYKCRRSLPQSSPAGDPTHDDDDDDDRPRGLDAKVLQSYPMFKYQELKRDDRTGMSCAICLADYNDADPVRLLPNCGHVFHVGCVDAWLVRHASCPNCRSSPEFLTLVQAPPVGPRQMTPHAL